LTGAEIRKTLVVDASPDIVFKALTDEKELVKWMPQESRIDARVGGRFEFKYRLGERGVERVVEGEILEFIPDKKLSYTFHPPVSSDRGRADGPPPASIVTWSLDELPGGKTRVTLVHEGIFGIARVAENIWDHYTAQLAEYCRSSSSIVTRQRETNH
jgi:uncharacterized protein YndB with AHSA1/START domain